MIFQHFNLLSSCTVFGKRRVAAELDNTPKERDQTPCHRKLLDLASVLATSTTAIRQIFLRRSETACRDCPRVSQCNPKSIAVR
ncbi:hypothetical protein KCP77_21230 [Salmonella enterica subsp. enterica]|nr:hypothetical protein KCP77_21230 [Salmonella enterica subsp. enterica]